MNTAKEILAVQRRLNRWRRYGGRYYRMESAIFGAMADSWNIALMNASLGVHVEANHAEVTKCMDRAEAEYEAQVETRSGIDFVR